MSVSCCTCASIFADFPPPVDETTEKRLRPDRSLECCGRVICRRCMHNNPRFATYCPYCQISTASTNPLPQGLREPPPYAPSSLSPPSYTAPPPAYNTIDQTPPAEKSTSLSSQPAVDVLHFLDHRADSLASLSLRYNVPILALRRTNNITSDHLLLARRTILIPGEFYKGGASLSPRPVEGEEEETRRGKIRRWMVACKVAEYEVALLYLKQAEYDLELAIETYKDDERWEKEHPVAGSIKGKENMKPDVGRRRFTGQRS